MKDLTINFSNLTDKRDFILDVNGWEGVCRIQVTQKRFGKGSEAQRSIAQNRFYFGVVVKLFLDFRQRQGDAATKEDCHKFLAGMFLRRSDEVVNKKTGAVSFTETIQSTTELTVREFSEFITKCMAWLSEFFGIVFNLHDPDYVAAMDEEDDVPEWLGGKSIKKDDAEEVHGAIAGGAVAVLAGDAT